MEKTVDHQMTLLRIECFITPNKLYYQKKLQLSRRNKAIVQIHIHKHQNNLLTRSKYSN